MKTVARPVKTSGPDAAYAVIHELRHFVAQCGLRATSQHPDSDWERLFDFGDGSFLVTPQGATPDAARQFIQRSAALTHGFASKGILTAGAAGPSVDGIGLERLLIAFEVASRYERQDLAEWTAMQSHWLKDISQLLSFFSQMAQRRYEKATAQMTVAYYPSQYDDREIGFGELGKPLIDEYKALLRLCRDAHTVLVVGQGNIVCDLQGDTRTAPDSTDLKSPLVPPRLIHLQRLSDASVKPIVFNLNANGSMEILAKQELVFRRVNNVWRFATINDAVEVVAKELENGGSPHARLVARNFLSLALDLADHGEGALPFLCNEPTWDILDDLFDSREGFIRSVPGLPYQELSARTRFTQLVGNNRLSLSEGVYDRLSPLLRDVCSIDGATVFSYDGDLLGFGCIVNMNRPTQIGARREGARSAAAKAVSRKGIAIKVSVDGDVTLFRGAEEWATFC